MVCTQKYNTLEILPACRLKKIRFLGVYFRWNRAWGLPEIRDLLALFDPETIDFEIPELLALVDPESFKTGVISLS